MKQVISFLTGLFFLASCVTAQPGQYSTTKKKAIKGYEDAITNYNTFDPKTGLPDFAGAEKNLQSAIKADPEFIEAYIMLSQVYMDWGKTKQAIEALNKSIEINPKFFPNSFLFLARLYQSEGDYESALRSINEFLNFPRIPEQSKLKADWLKKNLEFAIQAKRNPVPFKPENLGPGVNTDRPEYFPTLTADDQTLLFTRQVIDPDSPFGEQEDFFVSQKKDGKWTTGLSISQRINTIFNEGAPALSADGQLLIFTACEMLDSYGDYRDGFGSCDLFVSRRVGDDWTMPVNLGKPINSVHWESQPSFSADGRTLYYVRGIKGQDGRKQADIWTATINEKGEWSVPQRLSDVINTEGNEASVIIHPDGQTLYFSSDGHLGMGGLDIFMSRKHADGSWGTPVNLGYPINTYGDENSLLVSTDGKLAFFASDRPGGYGDLDLYSFELPSNVRPQVTTYFKGIVYDARTKKPLEARFQLIDLQTGELIVESYSDKVKGDFILSLATNRNYALAVERGGYAPFSKNFSLAEESGKADPFLLDVPLQPIDSDVSITLENVFFDLDKYTLRDESRIELNKLVDFLNRYQDVSIRIDGHTDSRGDKKANQLLSENRAKAVAEYLVQKGISKERLTWKGFGDSQPKVPNAQTEEEHQQNRRTEYTILKK